MVSLKITPVGRFDPLPDILAVIQPVLVAEQKNVLREFNITVRTWKRKPTFETSESTDELEVSTNNEIYGYLDAGTRPHIIRARRAPRLAFRQGGFRSKTVPNRLNSRAGKAATGPLRRPLQVNHPGFPARNYSKIIQGRSQRRLARNIPKALKAAFKKGK